MPDTGGSIIGKMQRALGDPEGTHFVPSVCLPYVNDAQDIVHQVMRANGIEQFRKQTPTAIQIPAGTGYTYLDKTTTPALPADFILPEHIWEKQHGAADTDYRLVTLLRGEIPPSVAQDVSLRIYSWQGGQLKFVSPLAPVDILIDYVGTASPFISPSDTVPVADTSTAIAYRAAQIAAAAREDIDSADLEAKAQYALQIVLGEWVQFKQRKPVRRQRFRYGPFRFSRLGSP